MMSGRVTCDDIFELTYRVNQAGQRTRHLTLWRPDSGDRTILCHQGTVVCSRDHHWVERLVDTRYKLLPVMSIL